MINDSVLRHLALTKVGFAIVAGGLLSPAFVGPIDGHAGTVLLGLLLAGAALWGYGYGTIRNADTDGDRDE